MNLADASIGQLMIPVDDFEAGVAFYRDVLGLPFLFAAPPQMAFFQCGAVRLLVGVPGPGHAAQRGSVIYFKVEEIGAVHAHLAAQGVRFSQPPQAVHKSEQATLWMAQLTDPDGNQLALMSEVAHAA